MNNRQRAFVDHYLMCWNASEAARRAGYKGAANVVGPRLLADVSISAAIQARLADLHMSADEVLQRLAEHARGNLAPFMSVDAQGLDLTTDRAQASLNTVKKFKVRKKTFHRGELSWDEVETEIELYDSQRALELIGRHLALFADVALTGDVNDWREYAKANGLDEAAVVAEAERIVNSRKRADAGSGAQLKDANITAGRT